MGKITTFTPEEVEEFKKSPSEKIREMLADNEEALEAFNQYAAQRSAAYFSAIQWLTRTMSALYKYAGPEALEESELGHYQPMVSTTFWDMSFRDRILGSIKGLQANLDTGIEIVDEDDEKLCFKLYPCVTGQKVYEAGLYDEPHCLAKCAPNRITAGRDDFPVYCTHAPILEMAAMNVNGGYPCIVMDFPDEVASCSCTRVAYKRKEDIPESYFTRVNRKKPE